MRFDNVSILSVAHVDAPRRVPTSEIEARLAPTFARIGATSDLLSSLTGIDARRYWDEGVRPSQVAAQAGARAIEKAGIDRARFGVLINTSVCRDYVEPSTACLAHGILKMPESCANFDVGNACLAFLDGISIAGDMIERGQIAYALVVDGESARFVTEKTIERLLDPASDQRALRENFATLTLGSGAVAMVLGRSDAHPEGHRVRGRVSIAATEHSHLCRGQVDHMITDASGLMSAGLQLARRTFEKAKAELGWRADALDELILHQVSASHTSKLCEVLDLDESKAFRIYPELGNVGPAAIPIALSKVVETGRLRAGHRVALMGIGSGLNCSMMDVLW